MKVNIEETRNDFTPVILHIDIEDQYDADCIIWCLEKGLNEIIKSSTMDTQIIKERVSGLINTIKPLGS